MWGLLGSVLIGILAGFIAGKIMKGGGFGCLWNLILGVVGGFVGVFHVYTCFITVHICDSSTGYNYRFL